MKIKLLFIYFMAIGSIAVAQVQKPVFNHLALHVRNLEKVRRFIMTL